MGDIDHDNRIEHSTNIIHGASNISVAQQICVDKNEDHRENSVHRKTIGGWTENEKIRIVQIDMEERQKGYGFMKRIKDRWDIEFPLRRQITAQNLCDNARRFRKSLGTQAVMQKTSDNRESVTKDKNLQWTLEMKVALVQIDTEERQKGRGFMRRVKDRWDVEYPIHAGMIGAQTLRDNATRFRKETEISNLVLVRKRNLVAPFEEGLESNRTSECGDRNQGTNTYEEEMNTLEEMIEETFDEVEDLQDRSENKLTEEDKTLDIIFLAELEKLERSNFTELQERAKLPKLKMPDELVERSNRVLGKYFNEDRDIPEVTDFVYAMGKAIASILGIKTKVSKEKLKSKGGNRRERKVKREMKELRKWIARISNEVHRRKEHRKASWKEKKFLKELELRIEGKKTTTVALMTYREQLLDQLRYMKVKLEKMMVKGKRVKNNALFRKDERYFYRNVNRSESRAGKIPNIDQFVAFWGGLWETEKVTPSLPWMEEVAGKLKGMSIEVKEFDVTEEKLTEIIKKRKNWSSPGIDGIQNYWWKKFKPAQQALCRALRRIKENHSLIPDWFPAGRTVMLPKTNELSNVKERRPITCLNTSYKIYTGIIGKYMREHACNNGIWDEGQLGGVEEVLGTVDQLLVDNCIMEEVKTYHRNLAVAYYDYRKAYDSVHHDWMMRVFDWIGIPEDVRLVLQALMKKWKTRLEVWDESKKYVSRWINISCGFLQGDSYSPVGFCLTEIPICILLSQTRGYRMGPPGERKVKRTHSLFIDDLKVYKESHQQLQAVNEILVQASNDTGACYGISKCAEIVFKHGKMVKGDGLMVLDERMRALDPDENDVYKFLGVEQAEGVKIKEVLVRVKAEMQSRLSTLLNAELYDKNLIKAINTKVIPVVAYVMNVCTLSKGELEELDQMIKRELRSSSMLGRQSSEERLYLKRKVGGRGLKSLRAVYMETKIRVACYMAVSERRWIKAAWEHEKLKDYNSLKITAEEMANEVGHTLKFKDEGIELDGELQCGHWRKSWKKIKDLLKKGNESSLIEKYKQKSFQSETFSKQEVECHMWLECNLDPRKTAAIVNLQEQMVETKAWKVSRGIADGGDMCRLCGSYRETVQHLLAGCQMLAGKEYLRRHNRALMVIAVAWAKKYELIDENAVWYKEKWEKGKVLENDKGKLVWDFEYKMRQSSSARRPDLTLEDKERKRVWICDMACPQESNIEAKVKEKLDKYQQLAFEMRENRVGHRVEIVPLVIGCLGGGVGKLLKAVQSVLGTETEIENTVKGMQKTVLMDSESIMRKVLSGVVQPQ